MNNLENVRKCMRIKRTPNDAGTKLMIEFTYYDNGFVSINGSAKGNYTPDEAERWLASTRFVMQMIEEFRNYVNKSKTSAAAQTASEAPGRRRLRSLALRCFLFEDPGSVLKGGVKVFKRPLVNEVVGLLLTEFVRNFGREGATPIQRGL